MAKLPLWIQAIILRHEAMHIYGYALAGRYPVMGRIARNEFFVTPVAPVWALIRPVVMWIFAPAAARAKVAAKPDFIIGVTNTTSLGKFTEIRDAVRANAAMGSRNVEVVAYKDFEAFSRAVGEGRIEGAFIDESYLNEAAAPDIVANITIEASRVFIGPSSRKELEKIMAELKALLPKIAAADIDEALKLRREFSRQQLGLKRVLDGRLAALQRAGGLAVTAPKSEATSITKPVAIAITEKIVENDVLSANNMGEVAKLNSVMPYFIFGTPGSAITSRRGAEEYLKGLNYSDEALSKMAFIDARGLTYAQVVGQISSDTGLDADNIGIAATADELTKTPSDKGILLQVDKVTRGGRAFYATLNTIPTLLNVLSQFNDRTLRLDNPVPDVIDGTVRGLFRYLPRIVPADYDSELRMFREAVKLIRSAA